MPGVKTNEVKLKVLADQLFDNLLATKDQVSNKTRMSELKTVFDKIKQNPIRFFDLMITIGKNNKALSDEAMKIIDFSQFDQCITMLIDLILQRLDYWMQLKSSTTTSATTISGMTMTVNTGTSATSTISPATGTVAPPQTTSSTTITITTPTIPTTTVTYTTPPIFSGMLLYFTAFPKIKLIYYFYRLDIVLIDPLYCNNYNLTNCAIVAGQPLNLVSRIRKKLDYISFKLIKLI